MRQKQKVRQKQKMRKAQKMRKMRTLGKPAADYKAADLRRRSAWPERVVGLR
jgi:hypothetical protein